MEKINTPTEIVNGLDSTLEFTNKVKDNVGNLISGAIKNRITLTSYTIVGCDAVILTSDIQPPTILAYLFVYLNVLVPVGLIFTQGGVVTSKLYQRTKRNLQKHGRIRKEYFINCMKGEDHMKWVGYCQLQGIYLAMKEHGMEEEFFRMKKELTNNKIPNF